MQQLIDFYKLKRKVLVCAAGRRVGPGWAEDAVHDAFERAVRYFPTYNSAIGELNIVASLVEDGVKPRTKFSYGWIVCW